MKLISLRFSFCCQVLLFSFIFNSSIIGGSLKDGYDEDDSFASAKNRAFNAVTSYFTLIRPDVAVTAQHTLPFLNQTITFKDRISGSILDSVKVRAVVGHKNSGTEYDIGLIFFEREVRSVTPIPIVTKTNQELFGKEIMGFSFGPLVRACYRGSDLTEIENPEGKPHIYKNQIYSYGDRILSAMMRDGDRIDPSFIPKEPLDDEGIPIYGDSGSPLLFLNDGRLQIAGVASGLPRGYYGDVGNWVSLRGHDGWIDQQIKLQDFLRGKTIWPEEEEILLDMQYKGVERFVSGNSSIFTIPRGASFESRPVEGDSLVYNSTLNLFGEFTASGENKVVHLHGGTIRGDGKVDGSLSNTWNSGLVVPGTRESLGAIDVTENFSQSAGCRTVLRIVNKDNDRIRAKKALIYGGALEVVFEKGMSPSVGTEWAIIETTGGITGEFQDVRFSNIPEGLVPSLKVSDNKLIVVVSE